MVAQKENEKKIEPNLYQCEKCRKLVVADDYNFYFKLCYKCEQKSGHNLLNN